MYFIIYKTTNTVNGKEYIGAHKTAVIDDGYLGSGYQLRYAIKKYGRSSFIRDVLFIFDNSVDMYNKERELVNETYVTLKTNYNIVIGGQGGDRGVRHGKSGWQNPDFHKRPDIIAARINGSFKKGNDAWNKGLPGNRLGATNSNEMNDKISQTKKGKGTRGNNSKALRVQDDCGNVFECLLDCAEFHNIYKETVRIRIKNGRYTKL